MKETSIDRLMPEHQYMVTPLGYASALKQHGINCPTACLIAQALFALAYRRHRQYHGKTHAVACRTSLAQLQEITGRARSTVQAALDRLEAAGLIRRGDMDRRGTLFDVSALADTFMQHAPKQAASKRESKKTPARTETNPHPTVEHADIPPSSTPSDPILNEQLVKRLAEIDKKIEQLRCRLAELSQAESPVERLRKMRHALKTRRPVMDEKAQLISDQLLELERERDTIRREIERITQALTAEKLDPGQENSELPRQVLVRPKRPARNHLKWMMRRLREMRVSNPMETACEILWALEHGWYATSAVTANWKPFQALASALKLIEQGRWRSPSGGEPWRYQARLMTVVQAQA